MKRLSFSLRLTIPAILLLMGCVAGGFSYLRQVSLTHERVKEELTQQAKLTAASTAQLLEYFYRRSALQESYSEGVTLVLSRLSEDGNLNLALFCDDQNQILSASHYELQRQALQNTALAGLAPMLDQVRRNRAGQIALSPDHQSIQAIYPVLIPPQAGELRSNRIGTIVLDYNLSKAENRAIADAINQSLQTISLLALLCILVGLLLDRVVTQRANRLVFASNQLARGDRAIRVSLQGSDELAQISDAFNRMAAQIEHDTEALQTSEQQLKAQTAHLETTLQELGQTQAQLVQQEKMSSLGQMVAGVAHEINNPVSFIHGNLPHVQFHADDLLRLLHLYQQYYPDPIPAIQTEMEAIDLEFLQADLPKLIHSMKIGTERIRQIVLSLRNFSRMDEAKFKPVNLHDGIESTLLLLQHRLKASPHSPEITVVRDYGTLPLGECYAGQINQVLMNILANAIDALEESHTKPCSQDPPRPPGQITIRTSMVEDQWVQIRIADNGPGMSESIQSKIFNPFFTTKPVGKGTGMGMSISYQIITETHGGKLECFSTLGVGTEFVIQIPLRQHQTPILSQALTTQTSPP